MARLAAFLPRLAVPALAGAALLFCAPAWAQGAGAGFETAPGSSQMITSTGQPVISVGPATPAAGVASQPGYGAFGDVAPAGMYVAPLGYGGGAAPQSAPVYSAQNNPAPAGAPLTPASGYSVQNQPTSGPFAATPQPSPYVQAPPYPLPQPYAYGAPTPDYAPQPYGQMPYSQPYAPPPTGYAQQPLPYAAQPAPAYAAAPQAPVFPQQPMPQQSYPQQPAPAGYAAQSSVPYAAGTTGYGAVLPRNVANVAAGAPAGEGGYTLGPGDKVRVTIYGETDLSGEYQLDGNGNIRLPLIGMMRAAGYTAGGLEAWIRNALVPNYVRNPRINVEIVGYRPIYVVGAVQKPGQYTYVNDMTLLNAVALAGGFTPQARESTVYVRHEGETAEQTVASNMPLLIRPGDTVRVDTTIFWDAVNFLGPLSSPVAIAATVR